MKSLIILLITLPTISLAQRNHPGIRYFDGGILLGGDTIQGKVGYHPGKDVVIFKNTSNLQYLSPSKIEGFYFSNGASFTSVAVQSNLDNSTHFFQQVVLGDSASLFYDLASKTYFLERHKEMTQINSKKPGRKPNNNLELVESKEYILALLQEMSNCKTITPVIHKTEVNQKDLSSLVSLYNDCLGAQHKIIPQIKPQSETHFGIRVGYELSRFKLKSTNQENTFATKTFLTAMSPSIGLYYSKELGNRFRKVVFINEINVIQENFKTYNEISLAQDSMESNEIKLRLLNIRMPFQFRIPLVSLNSKFNISSLFELTPILRLRSESSRIREVGYNNIFYTSAEEPFKANNLNFTQSIGLGFEFPNNRDRDIFFDMQVGRKSIPITTKNDTGAKNKNSYISFGLRLSL